MFYQLIKPLSHVPTAAIGAIPHPVCFVAGKASLLLLAVLLPGCAPDAAAALLTSCLAERLRLGAQDAALHFSGCLLLATTMRPRHTTRMQGLSERGAQQQQQQRYGQSTTANLLFVWDRSRGFGKALKVGKSKCIFHAVLQPD